MHFPPRRAADRPQRRRRCIIQPRVGATQERLPWGCVEKKAPTPSGLNPVDRTRCNPCGVVFVFNCDPGQLVPRNPGLKDGTSLAFWLHASHFASTSPKCMTGSRSTARSGAAPAITARITESGGERVPKRGRGQGAWVARLLGLLRHRRPSQSSPPTA